jgi:phosphohistidine phosphatase SixA
VRLFLVRHAHAKSGDPDELRPLSARGREEARKLGERFAAVEPTLVITSPLLRARETANAIAKAAGAELRIDERLAPGATADDIRESVAGNDGPVVTVGHQPDFS